MYTIQTATPVDASAAHSSKCPKCNSSIAAGTKTCGSCGAVRALSSSSSLLASYSHSCSTAPSKHRTSAMNSVCVLYVAFQVREFRRAVLSRARTYPTSSSEVGRV
ncbi:hypothetical protein EXIGLDRAFT_186513 [Exidia glandulosa HHB12029]|uniref:Zinc-ribbon domain-containing protein n=1 Tax=Exidia glandulosa HHB12029 TaxID=1314781 RepID=A0A165EZ35_EXIGL|nr:hypothetical protein EXIGLDRAFT_186513 [Exidia glandulosa HHB12029]